MVLLFSKIVFQNRGVYLQLVLLFDLKAAKVSLKKEKHRAHKKFYTI